MNLAVTIDTEADGQWDNGRPIETRNTGFLPPFQELCERHGVTPTYLIATEILEDERSRELLSSWARRGAAEIGAHLHPWTTPPFHDSPGLRYNDVEHAYPCQLPTPLLHEKIHTLTAQVRDAFGSPPTSFRAGRFGADARVARALAAEGYTIDSSVTPLVDWRREVGMAGSGGPDFRRYLPYPFRVADLGRRELLEVPVTVLPTYTLLRTAPALLELYRSLPARAARKLLFARWLQPQPMWLAPYPWYAADDLISVWRSAETVGVRAAVMILHSSELMPGGSPFRPDAEAVRDLLAALDAVFAFARRRGAGFPSLSSLAAEISAAGLLREKPL